MGNIISDITIDEQIKSNIRNIQRKYETRGIIELYFASIIKNNNWDKFIIKCCKQVDPFYNIHISNEHAPTGTFKLMCETAVKKNNIILNTILGESGFINFMNDIKPIYRPYALNCSNIILDFPDGFDVSIVIYELPITELIAIREIYTDNMNRLRVDQFKYDSSDTDSDILQNILLVPCLLRVSDALQLVNNIPVHCIYRNTAIILD